MTAPKFEPRPRAWLLAMLLLGAPLADACPRVSQTTDHLIVTVEGLMGRVAGSQAQSLALSVGRPLGMGNMSFSNTDLWTRGSGYVAECVAKWKSERGPGAKVTLMGHSLGGGHVNRIAEKLGQRNIQVKDMIVFDGRNGHELACGGQTGAVFRKPANVQRVTNFYQCGWMPGNTYADAPGVANIHVSDRGDWTHVVMPNDPEVRRRVQLLLADGTQDTTAFTGTFNQMGMGATNPLTGLPGLAGTGLAAQKLKDLVKDLKKKSRKISAEETAPELVVAETPSSAPRGLRVEDPDVEGIP